MRVRGESLADLEDIWILVRGWRIIWRKFAPAQSLKQFSGFCNPHGGVRTHENIAHRSSNRGCRQPPAKVIKVLQVKGTATIGPGDGAFSHDPECVVRRFGDFRGSINVYGCRTELRFFGRPAIEAIVFNDPLSVCGVDEEFRDMARALDWVDHRVPNAVLTQANQLLFIQNRPHLTCRVLFCVPQNPNTRVLDTIVNRHLPLMYFCWWVVISEYPEVP